MNIIYMILSLLSLSTSFAFEQKDVLFPSKKRLSEVVVIRKKPWLTEKSIVFIEEFLEKTSNAKILEFGSGASTIWFAKKNVKVTSIEHNEQWHYNISNLLKELNLSKNVDYILASLPYYNICEKLDHDYDLILIDGRNRKGCLVNCLSLLKPGGVLILDNAEREYYHSVFTLLNSWQMFSTEQTEPDSEGFWYKGWKTVWWIKPIKNI